LKRQKIAAISSPVAGMRPQVGKFFGEGDLSIVLVFSLSLLTVTGIPRWIAYGSQATEFRAI